MVYAECNSDNHKNYIPRVSHEPSGTQSSNVSQPSYFCVLARHRWRRVKDHVSTLDIDGN